MATRRLPLAPVLVIVGLVGLGAGPPAGADCMGPTIEHTVGTVDRSDTIHVVGTFWGDECYDTGIPPDAVGPIGTPYQDIEVVLVDREVEHVVATGDADADYEFEVDVPIPDDLTPGWVAIVARPPEAMPAYDLTRDPVFVSDVEPSGDESDDPVTFGRAAAAETATTSAPSERAPADDDPSVGGTIVVIVAVVALTLAVVVLFARARQGPSGPRPV